MGKTLQELGLWGKIVAIDCKSEDRICREYTVIKRPVPNRIYVIFINEDLGY